ncbi:CBS domain-containing protein [Niveibacterium umoris]|uniref:CBS domain-containing protein n=1 Tax=Niveibacterium umoris TaxID=1193620 RepID=A0A840BKA6_9RHOO|nr:CBS domain-containing protein [Niveibacterium umoris]MBB4013053.1 CBS domain-containing protein [Niveibacterium umoris]
MTISVRQVLQGKGSNVLTVSPDHSVLSALELMAKHDVGSVLVTEGERLAGIFTERDYARKVVLKGRTSAAAKIGELMTCNVLTVSPTQTIDDCMAIMTNNRIRHLPVVEKGQLIGIVTIGDAVKTVIEEQRQTINQLSSYISGDLAT